MKPTDTLIIPKAGSLSYIWPDGVLEFAIDLPRGKYPAREYLDLLPQGCTLETVGVVVVSPPALGGLRAYGDGQYDTGANPDFRPTSATQLELELRNQVKQAQLLNRTLQARAAALSAIEAIPAAPKPDDAVVEQ